MKTDGIRSTFLNFFEQRGHTIVPSSSLVPNDPSLLLTNAGMVQFKPYYTGERTPPYQRAASAQKVFREIDIEIVGRTSRHFTFFEMLGNFSFGDYFKREAIAYGWELIVDVFKLDPARIYATVHPDDEEGIDLWRREIGLSSEKVIALEANTWDMGTAGPCGKCSEILYDRGSDFGAEFSGGEMDEERYLEIWNLVFMESIQDEKGVVTGPLPRPQIDTGLGLARVAAILQEVPTSFDVDSMTPLLSAAEELTGESYGSSNKTDEGLRVIAEHGRAIAFLIADGVLPGNLGRGYVLRRLMRRALRSLRKLGAADASMLSVCRATQEVYGGQYPELASAWDLTQNLLEREQDRFERTTGQGLEMLAQEIAIRKGRDERTIPGDVLFKLHDTYGFSLDLSRDVAQDEEMELDMAGFEELMKEQRERARGARMTAQAIVMPAGVHTEFLGYDSTEGEGKLIQTGGADILEQGQEGFLVLDATTFYGEGGGQVGDTGLIEAPGGHFRVQETRRSGGVIIHTGVVTEGELRVGDTVRTHVEVARREEIQRSHTATHILHFELRQLLGDHVRQSGSLVDEGRLRFDFTHFEGLSADQLFDIEENLTSKILADDDVSDFETSFDEAKAMGAMALFGEKYGDRVRVVKVGDYSLELCGGTHVRRTSGIVTAKLISEGSVAAGIRRLEVLTGRHGFDHLRARATTLEQAARSLRTDPTSVMEKLEATLELSKKMEGEIRKIRQTEIDNAVAALLKSVDVSNGVLVDSVEGRDQDSLRRIARGVADGFGTVAVALVSHGDKTDIAIAIPKDLVARGVSAAAVAKNVGALLEGGGGGRPDAAFASGKWSASTEELIRRVRSSVEEVMAAK